LAANGSANGRKARRGLKIAEVFGRYGRSEELHGVSPQAGTSDNAWLIGATVPARSH